MQKYSILFLITAGGLVLVACAEAVELTYGGSAGGHCGDGIVNDEESCDNGNLVDGDGCSADCQQEAQSGSGVSTGTSGDGGANSGGGAGGDMADGGSGGAELVSCSQNVNILAPMADSFVAQNGTLPVGAYVSDSAMAPVQGLTVQWESTYGQLLGTSPVAANGQSSTTLAIPNTVSELHARVITPEGACDTTSSVRLYVCLGNLSENFNTVPNPQLWTVHGSAYWDNGGWLEMTGISQGQKGAILNDQYVVGHSHASIKFKIYTGGGSIPGADGFAVTIIETQQPGDLAALVAAAPAGGGLGYAVGGSLGSFTGSAFTVEIDTWYNNDIIIDPTPNNHLEITLNADPNNSLAYVNLPNVQDQQWHDIGVDIIDTRVRVFYDHQLALDVTDPSFHFNGGRLFFSGSTGAHYNWHRFDDLVINHTCY